MVTAATIINIIFNCVRIAPGRDKIFFVHFRRNKSNWSEVCCAVFPWSVENVVWGKIVKQESFVEKWEVCLKWSH